MKLLPYNSVETTKSIKVLSVSLVLDITPPSPWTAGETITLKATLKYNGTPQAGKTIVFRHTLPGVIHEIGRATTDAYGVASVSYAIPWAINSATVPCRDNSFQAENVETGTVTAVSGKVAYPTRISISTPDRVTPNAPFTISGKLEYESSSGVWSPLAGKTVSLYYDGTHITDVTTGTDGSYSTSASIPTSGTYTLKASYAGAGFALTTAKLTVTETAKSLIVPLATLIGATVVLMLALKA